MSRSFAIDARLAPALLILACAANAQDRIHVQPALPGLEGSSLTALGDVDSDGFSDLAVGIFAGGKCARVVSGFSGKALFDVPDFGNVLTTGVPMANASDLDGDGADDLIVGYLGASRAAVFSGRTGSLLLEIPLPHELAGIFGSFGFAVSGAGDLDGDERVDVLVGAPGVQVEFGGQPFCCSGRVYAISGATGHPLFHVDSPLPSIGFGSALDRLGDVDGDAVPDFLVGSERHAFVVSGSDGSLLHHFTSGSNDGFGLIVVGCDDLDGDALPDVAVGGSGADPDFVDGPGFVVAFSGATGAQLWRVDGTGFENLGKSISRLPDADGDDIDDLVVGAPGPFFPTTDSGKVVGLSGTDGATLFTVEGDPGVFRFAFFVEGLTDVNGDGAADFALTSTPSEVELDIDSTSDLALVTDGDFVSLASGGSQTMHLQLGPAAAGRPYVLIGSATGIQPGLSFKGHHIPLNFDAYTLLTITQPTLIAGAVGTLDATGEASATLAVPPLALPALVGLTLEHAAVVWAAAPGGPVLSVTNAVTLRFEP